jgi:hypothetical protein
MLQTTGILTLWSALLTYPMMTNNAFRRLDYLPVPLVIARTSLGLFLLLDYRSQRGMARQSSDAWKPVARKSVCP